MRRRDNNAGFVRGYPLSAADAEAWSVEDVDVNLGGSIRMTRLALPLLENVARLAPGLADRIVVRALRPSAS